MKCCLSTGTLLTMMPSRGLVSVWSCLPGSHQTTQSPAESWAGLPSAKYISFPSTFHLAAPTGLSPHTTASAASAQNNECETAVQRDHHSCTMSSLGWAVVGAAVIVMVVMGVDVARADECSLRPVIHILSYPGCTSQPIPSFACQGQCTSYVQVGSAVLD